MNTNTQSLFDNFTALGTYLTSVSGVNLHNSPASIFCFARENQYKGIPSRISDRLSKMMVLEKSDSVKVFHSDDVIFIHQLTCDFVSCILSLIGNMFVCPLKYSNSFMSAVRTFLSTRNFALLSSELVFRLAKVFGRFKEFAFRCGDKVTDTHVKSNNSSCWFKRLRFRLSREAYIVSSSLALDNCGLDIANNRTMPFDFDFADMLDIELTVIAGLDSIAIGELDRVKAVTAFEARVSGLSFAGLYSAEEGTERFIEPFKRALNRTEVSSLIVFVGFSGYLVGCRLVSIGNRLLRFFPRVLSFSKGVIVYTPVRFKHFVNRLNLLPCWI